MTWIAYIVFNPFPFSLDAAFTGRDPTFTLTVDGINYQYLFTGVAC